MHSSIAFVLLAGAAVVSGQNAGSVSTYPPFNISDITDANLYAWCNDQLASCPLLCLDQGSGAPNSDSDNTCDSGTLDWTCTCANGKTVNTTQYSQTVTFHICQQSVEDCKTNCYDDNQCVYNCGANKKCGATDPKPPTSTKGSHKQTGTGVAGDGYANSATATASSTGSINLKGGSGSSGNSLNAFGSYYSVGVVVVSFGLSIFAFVQ